MSETQTPPVGQLDITHELVESVFQEVKATPFPSLQHEEMTFASKHDRATLIVYEKMTGQHLDLSRVDLHPRMLEQQVPRAAGYLLTHRLLRYAVAGPFAERQSSDALVAYYKGVLSNRARLDRDFARDWNKDEYPAVVDLVEEKLPQAETKFGSKLLLVIHGRLANPNQPPFPIPGHIDQTVDTSPRALPIPRPRPSPHEIRAARSTNARMAALVGSHNLAPGRF